MRINTHSGTLSSAHKLDVLRQHCAAVGRDYDTIVKTWSADAVVIAETAAEARRIAEASPYNSNAIIGTPAQVAQQLQVFIDLGVEYLIVISHSADWSQVRLHVTAVPDADAVALDVVVRPDGYVVPQRTDAQLGAEAIRIIATAIRAGQRNADD